MSRAPESDWERRYRAHTVTFPAWSPHAPDRLVYVSDESGTPQAHTWDLTTGERLRATEDAVGLIIGEHVEPTMTADGRGVVWFRDPTGSEEGRWMVHEFGRGSDAEARELLPGVPPGWASGLAVGRRVLAGACSGDGGFTLWVSRDDGEPEAVMHSPDLIEVPVPEYGGFNAFGLSADEGLLAVRVAGPGGDNLHLQLRVLDSSTGGVVAELFDGERLSLDANAWSPVEGDDRLVVISERTGWPRPELWSPRTGERRPLVGGEMPGEWEATCWWPDGSAVLLLRLFEGRNDLWRADVATGGLERLDTREGSVWAARVRPDAEVWYSHDSAVSPTAVYSTAGETIIAPPGEAPPPGRSYRSRHFDNGEGQQVHAFVVTPGGDGPFPLLMEVHGGPDWYWGDYWSPRIQAYVDAGFAVALVNYRGSMGCGMEWRDWLIANVGFPETADTVAAADALVAEGLADPRRVAIGGRSWGGYITLLASGLHPAKWRAACAVVPVGDYRAAFYESSPISQAYDRTQLGGHEPDEIPEFVAERSPITYADRVRSPLMVVFGENDSRCPPQQVRNYLEALRAAGNVEPEVLTYDTGHSANDEDEEIAHMRAILDFLCRHVLD